MIKLMIVLQVLNEVIVVVAWFSMRNGEGYVKGGPDPEPGSGPIVSNAAVLSFYLFTPFWALYFVMGAVLAFIYDTYKPGEKHNAYIWGYIADICTLAMLALTAVLIAQPENYTGEDKMFRPELANNSSTDTESVYRLWSDISGRLLAPLTTLWIFGLSTGEGFTAKLLRNDFWVNTLGPHAYNCYLFHQMVGQWYWGITRGGLSLARLHATDNVRWWNWWNYRKQLFWFSPAPCPVEWYEFFLVVGCIVAFSSFVDNTVMPVLYNAYDSIHYMIKGEGDDAEDVDIPAAVMAVIEKMTGIEPDLDSTLDEVGLASVGLPVIVGMLNSTFGTKKCPMSITAAELVDTETIEDMIAVVEGAFARMKQDGI